MKSFNITFLIALISIMLILIANNHCVEAKIALGTFKTISSNNNFNTPSTTELHTPLRDLANDFNEALNSINNAKEDIHVGRLMAACARLESTIRKMGFGTSANDIANNLKKIQSTYQMLPPGKRDSMPALLEYEQKIGMHPSNGKLKENSATMGFLWLGRSINYQYDFFMTMLEKPDATPYEAASHAYAETFKPHLSWPLQKLGSAALNTMKPIKKSTILANMGGVDEENYGPEYDVATKNELKNVISAQKQLLGRWNAIFSEMGLEHL